MDPTGNPQLAELYKELVAVASNLQVVSYFHVASVFLYTYDYLLTLGMEMEYIWKGSWNFLKVLYILQRYLPFFDTGFLVLYHHFLPNPSPVRCHYVYLISGWSLCASMAISEVILSFRVWVVWQRSKLLAILLPIFFCACWAPTMFFEDLVLNSVIFGDPPYTPHNGCFITAGKQITYICWIFLLIYEAGLLMLMLISALRHERSSMATSLAGVVYRDGILYYIYLFVLSLANVIIIVLLPAEMGETLSSLERVSYSLLTSRVVLHIRRHAQKSVHGTDMTYPTAIYFAAKENTLLSPLSPEGGGERPLSYPPPPQSPPPPQTQTQTQAQAQAPLQGQGMLAQELYEMDQHARPVRRPAPPAPPSSFRHPFAAVVVDESYNDDHDYDQGGGPSTTRTTTRPTRPTQPNSRRSSWARSFLGSLRSEDIGLAM